MRGGCFPLLGEQRWPVDAERERGTHGTLRDYAVDKKTLTVGRHIELRESQILSRHGPWSESEQYLRFADFKRPLGSVDGHTRTTCAGTVPKKISLPSRSLNVKRRHEQPDRTVSHRDQETGPRTLAVGRGAIHPTRRRPSDRPARSPPILH